MFHNSLDIHEIKELRLNTLVSFGCGAIRKIEEIAAALEKRGVRSLPAVTGRGAYKTTGTWDYVVSALEKHHIKYVLCDKVTSDPTTAQIDEAALMTGLFEKQTRFVSIDAVNHSVEAVTSAIASPLSITPRTRSHRPGRPVPASCPERSERPDRTLLSALCLHAASGGYQAYSGKGSCAVRRARIDRSRSERRSGGS
nr:iron-containing alcohol dehydrogenase [Victivallis vadensis]